MHVKNPLTTFYSFTAYGKYMKAFISSVQSFSHVQLFATP